MKLKMAVLGIAAALVLTVGAGSAQADRRDDCRKKINKEEDKFRDAVRKHGRYSRQAQDRRQKLERAYSECRGYGINRGRDDNWWGWGQDRDRDDRWNRGRDDNTWNRGHNDRGRDDRGRDDRWRDNNGRDNRGRNTRNNGNNGWFWNSDRTRHRHTQNGAWCNQRH